MSAFPTLWKREMGAAFRTPVAYVSGTVFLLVTGAAFWMLALRLSREPSDATMASLLFGSPWLWLALLLATPLLTMRLFAEEYRMGTMETLMTAPVTETEVVLAKFAGAYSTFLLLWIPTLAYGPLLAWCGAPLDPAAWGPVGVAYLGVALIGAPFIAAGLLCSLLTRHQMVAAMLCLAVLGLLLTAGELARQVPAGPLRPVSVLLSIPRHMDDFAAGVIDSRTVLWHASAAVLLLFASIRLLEARRLR